MFRLLRRILGWDTDSGPFDFDCLEQPARPHSSTASVLSEKPKPVAHPTENKDAANAPGINKKPAGKTRPANQAPKEKTASEILDNPELSLNGPQDEGFDPYNTGAFNRSSSWEKIAKNRANR